MKFGDSLKSCWRACIAAFICVALFRVELTPVWAAGTLPIKLEATFIAGEYINLDELKRPKPIELCLYELKSSQVFDNSDYFTLSTQDKAALGNDLLRKECFILRPGEQRKVERETDPQTTAIGLLAGYRELDRYVWRATYKLPQPKADNWINSLSPSVSAKVLMQVGGYGIRVREIK